MDAEFRETRLVGGEDDSGREKMKSENKTKQTKKRVSEFIDAIKDQEKRNDSLVLVQIMESATGEKGRMWGETIVGFGMYHYIYESGREGDWLKVAFSPRKQNLTVYLTYGMSRQTDLLEKLGKHETGKACLYIHRLADVDLDVLKEMILRSYQSFK
jgi:hypothetical protein